MVKRGVQGATVCMGVVLLVVIARGVVLRMVVVMSCIVRVFYWVVRGMLLERVMQLLELLDV